MSSETPAAHLARLKLTYPSWSIRAIEPFKGIVVLGQTAGKVAWSSAEPVRWSVRAREILAG
jgi:hypothetical protein